MDPQGCGDLLAVTSLAARDQIQGMQPLPFLAIGFTFHTPQELCGALGDGRHLLSHPGFSPSTTGESKDTRIMDSQLLETISVQPLYST
jgi:hypothetical protein